MSFGLNTWGVLLLFSKKKSCDCLFVFLLRFSPSSKILLQAFSISSSGVHINMQFDMLAASRLFFVNNIFESCFNNSSLAAFIDLSLRLEIETIDTA